MTRSRAVGLHVSIARGPRHAVDEAERLGCDAVQVFPSNPRAWRLPEPDPRTDAALRDACEERGWPLYVHAPYLVNPGTPDREHARRSAASLAFARARGARFGAAAVVVHAGSALGGDVVRALRRAADMLRSVLDREPGPPLAIELTAGGRDRSLARRVPDAAELLAVCGGDERLGVCLDTCHLWAAGVDWSTPDGLARLRREVRDLGTGRVLLLHVNDSRDPLGSALDHHEHIGAGTIGTETIGRFLAAPEWADVAAIVETGAPDEAREADVARVRDRDVR